MKVNASQQVGIRNRTAGFTIIEFLVAMILFGVIGGATLSLFASHAPLFNRQQNLAGLNIALQNTVAQMQLDLVNAGTGFYPSTNMPSWPVAVTIKNQTPTTDCRTQAGTVYTYTSACFDTLTILTVNASVLPAHPTDATGGVLPSNCSLTTAGTMYIAPYTPIGAETAAQTLARTASSFQLGDQWVLVSGGNGGFVNTFVITGVAEGSNYVAVTHAPSNADGTNSTANDPLSITTVSQPKIGTSFCYTDWLMKLEPTIYAVNLTNPQDPQLMRQHGGSNDVIADQVIGFKVGATTWQNQNDTSSESYYFDSQTYYNNNFTLVRSVRVEVIGRTNPNPDPTYTFKNSFDGGPYEVVGATVVVNPRNVSMNNN